MELVRQLALVLATGSALAAAAALAGAFVEELDIAGHLTPFWLATAALAVGLLALEPSTGGSFGPGLAAFAIGVGAALTAPELLARLKPAAETGGGERLKLIQFNVWDRSRDPEAAADWLRSEHADIVVLEEVGRGAVPAALADIYPFRTPDDGGRVSATMILSKTAPTDGGLLAWPGLGPRHVGAWARFGEGAGAFTVVGTHFRWPAPLARQGPQTERFLAALKGVDRESLIVAGDINLTPWSFALKRLDRRLGLARLTHGLATFPAGWALNRRLPFTAPLLAIDQVWAGRQWQALSVARGRAAGSDHYPVVVVLRRLPAASK